MEKCSSRDSNKLGTFRRVLRCRFAQPFQGWSMGCCLNPGVGLQPSANPGLRCTTPTG